MSSPRRGSLFVIFLTVFIDLLGFGMVLPLLPLYAKQYSLDKSGIQLGILMASFSAMQFIFAPLWGRLSDRVGRRPVLMVGLFGSVLFYGLFGVASELRLIHDPQWSLTLLFVARIGAGIAGATISTAQAYIADTTTLEGRSKGMALIGMAFGLGFTFGPLLGFLAVPSGRGEPGPWPGYAAAILSAGALLLAAFVLPESLNPQSSSAGRKVLDWEGWRAALSTPSVGLILLAIFVCVFSFANFETTVSLLIKGEDILADVGDVPASGDEGLSDQSSSPRKNATRRIAEASPFHFTFRQVCLTYAFIGVTLALVQGGIVRRLSNRLSEGTLAAIGAVLEVLGFGLMLATLVTQSGTVLFLALAVVVAGFSFMTPSLNGLLSRRSDPEHQGAILGVGQSVSALSRILGSGLGIPLLAFKLQLPYFLAAALMALGLVLVIAAARGGKDYAASQVPS